VYEPELRYDCSVPKYVFAAKSFTNNDDSNEAHETGTDGTNQYFMLIERCRGRQGLQKPSQERSKQGNLSLFSNMKFSKHKNRNGENVEVRHNSHDSKNRLCGADIIGSAHLQSQGRKSITVGSTINRNPKIRNSIECADPNSNPDVFPTSGADLEESPV
jgi:hypothetical protein